MGGEGLTLCPAEELGFCQRRRGGRGPRANGEQQERELQSGFVCAVTPELPAQKAQSPRCQRIGTPLLWERNVCYVGPAPCPPATRSTVLFVAASAQKDLLGLETAPSKFPHDTQTLETRRTGDPATFKGTDVLGCLNAHSECHLEAKVLGVVGAAQ